MTQFRSFLFFCIVATSLTVEWNTARADEVKPTTPVPATPDFAKDKSLPEVFDKPNPESIEDLKAIQTHVKSILAKVIPCTVCVQVGESSGSGVIVSEDGVILTAAHVSGTPHKPVTVIMPDGKKLKGKTLGGNSSIDSGMIKITDEGKYKYVEMGKAADLKKGTWCITTGHPGGYKAGRSPVVRVGRILENTPTVIRTDCTLVGGDSGGPLFDMYGRVIGIHSRIGPTITSNMHVPVDTYRETWTRLASGERWRGQSIGFGSRAAGEPYYGFHIDQIDKDCKVIEVVKDSPAEKAGFKVDDIVKRFDGKEVADSDSLREWYKQKKPGDKVTFEIQRGKEMLKLEVVVGKKDS